MIKFIVILFSLLVATHAGISSCFSSGKIAKDMFFSIMDQTDKVDIDKIIDDLSDFAKFIPKLLSECGAEENAKGYNQELPVKCIDDLDEVFKIAFDLIKQSDNPATFTFDLLIFEKFFNNKVKKQCPFLNDVSILQITNKANCMQSAKKMKNYLDDIQNDVSASNYYKTIDDVILAVDQSIQTLDKCGQSQLATQIRNDLPVVCLSSLNRFAKYIVDIENNYNHLEWLLNNYRNIFDSYNSVSLNCPIFE